MPEPTASFFLFLLMAFRGIFSGWRRWCSGPNSGLTRLAICLLCVGTPVQTAKAVTATALSSFEGIEEPQVRYVSEADELRPDDFANITDLGGGAFRMQLRYRSDEWDGDRDTHNKDRQRAEVKGLGIHQKADETFDYATTWRTNAGFRGASRFCHIFQLKSTDGDSGAPVVTISIAEGERRAALRYWPGQNKESIVAREFAWMPDQWQTVRVRIRISETNRGEVLASIDGDAWEGARDVAVYRTDATDYRPKWGLYRAASSGLQLGDDYVEHKHISAERAGAPAEAEHVEMEIAARKLMKDSPSTALAWLQSQPLSPARGGALATVLTDWAGTDPAAAMAFSETLTPAEGRSAAMQRVFNRWADQDADAVLRWARARAPATELDLLLWYFSTDTTLRYVARDTALAGAALIKDSELRARALGHVVLIWARSEPQQAAGYVETSVMLTAEQKAAIMGKFPVRKL